MGDDDKTGLLVAALRAEAERRGIQWNRASDADIARLTRALPEEFKADLTAMAEGHGWDPVEFMVFAVRPLFDVHGHDYAECAERLLTNKRNRRGRA
jgi:hypothetical protein